jgi:tetraacyldisaccharide 4'-kinase
MITRRDPEMLLRRYWERPDTSLVSVGLSFLAVGYRVALAARERAYRWRLLGAGRLPCPVISVGNVTLGGSGKTPLVELVARGLRELGAAPAVVSRGYGRNTRGARVAADRDGVKLGARAAGDEPILLAERLPGIPVIVGENRFEAARIAVERCGATAIVLDDGFQHRTLHKDLEIVAINGQWPWGNRRLFPRGMLREPLSALERAGLVVVTNPGDLAQMDAIQAVIRRYNDRAPVVSAVYDVVEARQLGTGRRFHPDELSRRRLLAFAGLGSPRGFGETLAAAGVDLPELVEYPDHHWFTERDLEELDQRGRALGAEGLITTEKDGIRLREVRSPALPCWVLSIRLRTESGGDALVEALARAQASATAER